MIELIIGEGVNQVSLDLTSDAISIALQYSIDDIRNIEKKNSNYSKNITLQGTKKNNKAFGNLFDVNQTFDSYNVNKKINARIIENSSPIIEGYLQLIAVNKLNTNDIQGNSIEYKVVVFDNSVDFFQTIGDKLLKDLNVEEFDHLYDQDTIQFAWTNHTFNDLYQYPLMDNVKPIGYVTTDFKPAFYHKGLLLEIAKVSGYSLEGSFIDSNTQYDKEIISWDGNTPKISDSDALSREFRAGFVDANKTIDSGVITNFPPWGTVFTRRPFNYDNEILDNPNSYEINQSVTGGVASTYYAPKTAKYNFHIKQNFNISYTCGSGGDMSAVAQNIIDPSDGAIGAVRATLRYVDTNEMVVGASDAQPIAKYQMFTGSGTKTMNKDLTFLLQNVPLIKDREVYIDLKVVVLPNSQGITEFYWKNGGVIAPVTITLTTNNILNNGDTSVFFNKTVTEQNIQDGDLVELNQYLPKEIKQKDLFIDLIRRYNLYITRNPIKNKTLILQTRDDYYNNNPKVLNWTQKKDYNSEDNINFLAELQNKELVFSYKPSPDLVSADGRKLNESYTKSTGDIYSQKKISFDNDFVTGTKNIESIFGTAPLVFRGSDSDGNNNVVVPCISSNEGKRTPSLLYWGGLIPVVNENGLPETLNITWGDNSTPDVYSTYAYAGHYDNPINPVLDIHFGEVTYEYYGVLLNNTTTKTLFNQYWRNYIDQISTGKLVTSYFNLNETDISYIKDNLNARIFVKDSYYNINKIVDYKPLENGLTKVELLKIDKGSTFESTVNPAVDMFVSPSDADDTMTSNDSGPYMSSTNNNVNSPSAMVIGENNYIGGGTNGVINGDNNNVGGNSTGVNIQGNSNTVLSGLNNILIIGNNQTATQSNTSIINGVTISDGILSSVNIVKRVEIELGDWDMDATNGLNVAHGLSVTEWKTVRDVSVIIRNDVDSAHIDYVSYTNSSSGGNTMQVNSTNVFLSRAIGGFFDSTTFDSTSFNRGWITFNYTPD